MSEFESARDRLAIALDVESLDQAESLIEALAGAAGWLKVGGELFTVAGPPAIAAAAALLIAAVGVFFHAAVNQDKLQLVPPTGVVYEGEPRPTPEIWKRLLSPSHADSEYLRSRRSDKGRANSLTPPIWKRLQEPSRKRR